MRNVVTLSILVIALVSTAAASAASSRQFCHKQLEAAESGVAGQATSSETTSGGVTYGRELIVQVVAHITLVYPRVSGCHLTKRRAALQAGGEVIENRERYHTLVEWPVTSETAPIQVKQSLVTDRIVYHSTGLSTDSGGDTKTVEFKQNQPPTTGKAGGAEARTF